MRNYVLALAFLAALLTAGNVRVVPDRFEETIAEFLHDQSGGVAGECARHAIMAAGGACDASAYEYHVQDAWTVTRISLAIGGRVWTANEACDVDIDFGDSTTTTFLVGATGLAAAGDSSSVTSLTDHSLAIGDDIDVRHDDPAAQHCLNGPSSCDCDSHIGSYNVRIFGYRTP